MFERFTKEARGAVTRAVGEAERRGDPRVGTEHLLIGLAGCRMPFDRSVLAGLDLPVEDLRRAVDRIDREALAAVGLDPALATSEVSGARHPRRRRHLPFTRAAKQVLEGTLRESLAMRDRHLGPEHLLLALLNLPPSDPVRRSLDHLGVDVVHLRAGVIGALRRAS
jgi:ATP-dependent Clp protease ATP-binding subunit ClpA